MKKILLSLLVLLLAPLAHAEKLVIRIGHFPNVTHLQGLVGHQLSRQGKGWFEQRLGPDVEVQWFSYNGGPSAMEAMFARSIDLTYVGPSPAINAYTKARGNDIRIIAGAANGGSALVVQAEGGPASAAEFRGRKLATPQLGNTQDVAARAWLKAAGLRITQMGGDAQVLPASNPDQLALFQQKKVDGVWTVEPWVSRLEMEAGGKVLVEEPQAVTTVLVSSVLFLNDHREVAQRLLAAHRELTEWIKANPEEAQRLVVAELSEQMRRTISPALVAKAWPRIRPTSDVSLEPLQRFVEDARKAGFLRNIPDLGRLVFSFETPAQ